MALATDLNVNMSVDNYFTAYISTDDTVVGTPFVSSDNWQAPVSASQLHVPRAEPITSTSRAAIRAGRRRFSVISR